MALDESELGCILPSLGCTGGMAGSGMGCCRIDVCMLSRERAGGTVVTTAEDEREG